MDWGVVQASYSVLFGLSGLGCVIGAWRAMRLDPGEVRRALVGLLLVTAVWASAELARLLVHGLQLKSTLYSAGLVVGLAAVFCWLHFVSVYTGARIHGDRRVQSAALAVFLIVSTVKLTNPLHGAYFTATVVTEPFRHLAIDQHLLHWVITAGVYVAVGVGFVRLFETFEESGYDTTWLAVLATVAAAPVGLVLVSNARPDLLLELNYEPVGVALFSLGALYLVEDTFVGIGDAARRQVIERVPPGIVVVDRDERVVDYDQQAATTFPSLSDRVGAPVSTLHPELGTDCGDGCLIDVPQADGTGHFLVTATSVSLGPHEVGHSLVINDVTEVETQRRELARQNRQLDELAAGMSHELRNPLNVVLGELAHVERLLADEGSDPQGLAHEAIDRAERAAQRMVTVVDDVQRLATQGKTLDDTEWCSLAEVPAEAWEVAGTSGAELVVLDDGEVVANRTRFKQLLVASVGYLADGSDRVTVSLEENRLVLVGEGRACPSFDLDELLERGYTAGADRDGQHGVDGVGLSNVGTLAGVHGWVVTGAGYDGGVRFVFEGVEGRSADEPVV